MEIGKRYATRPYDSEHSSLSQSLLIGCGEELCQYELQINHTASPAIGTVFDSSLIITTRLTDGGDFAVCAPL